MRWVVSVATVLLALTACAPSINVTTLNPSAQALDPAASVRVFTDRATVPGGYVEIALITGEFSGDDSEIIEAMVDEARALGANGLLLLDRSSETSGGTVVYGSVIMSSSTTLRGVAISYEPASAN